LYLISYEKDSFYIEPVFNEFVDKDQFDETILYLQQLFLFYNSIDKKYKIPNDRVDEIILFLEKDSKEYEISSNCADKLSEIQSEYKKKELKFFRDRTFDPSILNEGVVPYNYQIDAINWRLKRSAYLDSFDAGLGKTFANICVFSQLYKHKEIDGIVIIVPIGLSFHWVRQIIQFTNVFKEEDIQMIDNSLKIQPFNKFQDKKILIIRQDLIADVVASYKKDYSPKKSLKNLRWNSTNFVDIKKEWNKEKLLLLIDEGHSIKHMSSIKTKAIHNIKKYFDYRLLLTATPAINGMEDIYSLIKLIDNSIIPMSENAFKLWIASSLGNKWDRYAINSYNTNNVQKLMSSYQHVFSQARKEDIDEVKTKKIIKPIELELTSLQKKLYQLVVEKELAVLQQEFDTITWKLLLSKIHLLLEVFDNPELLKSREYNDKDITSLLNKWKIENDPKFIYLKNRVEDICDDQKKKIIIYDIHPKSLDELAIKFKSYNPLVIHGQIKCKDKDKDRQEKQDLFNFDSKHKMILLSLYTSSAGINLQHGSSNIFVHTLGWDATLFRQAQDRIYRVDSKVDSLIELPYYSQSLDNLRMKRNFSRIELNSRMDQEVTERDLHRLLNGDF
jgi:SNF2 family DNA or RNA helicase